MKVLVLNAGSSSQKSRVYEVDEAPQTTPPEPLWEANADWSQQEGKVMLSITTARGQRSQQELPADSRPEVMKRMLETLWSGEAAVIHAPSDIDLISHRVVHGGSDYTESVLITPQVKEKIKELARFAPLHNPLNVEGIEAAEQTFAGVPQVAVFDTTFHKHMSAEAIVYPGPYAWFEQGIRRYGFHGISHQYCAERINQLLGGSARRIVNCHLGNGCSLAAICDGRSVDTTMGFTPLEGVMMGTRSGTVDPSILIYLQREKGYSADQLEQELNKASGLKGISGVSGDMREIHKQRAAGNERAALAWNIYVYRLRAFICAMIAALEGIDVLSFAGGVGENDAQTRAAVCDGLAFLGIKLDHEKNERSPADQLISMPDSTVQVVIIHTEEDWEIAKEAWKLARTTPS